MHVSELIQSAPGVTLRRTASTRDGHPGATSADGANDPEITIVTEDSRRVRPGALFVARPGSRGDGAEYIADALARGAVAIVGTAAAIDRARDAERRARESRQGGAHVETSAIHWCACDAPARVAAHLAHAHAGWPSRTLDLVAVTGTNGKTTVSSLVRQLLEASGIRCGLIGTVEVHDGASSAPASLTTPGAEEIVRALAAMRSNGCRAASMETSSHALHQERTAGLDFRIGIFTNLTGDHLDYHGTMEEYAAAKARLFEALAPEATAIVNAMDPAQARMLRHCRARVIRCGVDEGATASSPRHDEATVTVHRSALAGTDLTFAGPWGTIRTRLSLPGRHNAMNALQAIAAASALGVSRDDLERAIGRLRAPPGRLEPVTPPDAPFQVLVDYAHTDDALTNVLSSLRPMIAPGARSIVVFGCGGDRDPTKRPRMALAACRGADLVFVTSDNPRREAPESIIEQIMTGVPEGDRPRVRRDVDRARTIRAAIVEARAGDVVVIAGKGHEDYQIVGTEKRHFDDREVAREVLADLAKGGGAAGSASVVRTGAAGSAAVGGAR